MSYAAYIAAGEDPKALLNSTFMKEQTENIFTRFFQHYVSLEVSFERGYWAYQPIGATLDGVGPVADNYYFGTNYTPPTGYKQLNTNRTADAVLSTRVEILDMDPVATWLSIAILIYLCLVALVVAATQRHYVGSLDIKIECMADMLGLVAGSDELLRLVSEKGVQGLRNNRNLHARLQTFHSKDGTLEHMVEVVGPSIEERPYEERERKIGPSYARVQDQS
jgi:hypothetical protein